MKKTMLTLLLAMSALAPMAVFPSAAQAAGIGVVDVQRILQSSPLLKALEQAQQEVAQAEQKLMEAREKKRKELQEKQQTLSPEDFRNLVRKYEDEIIAQAKAEETKLGRRKEEIRTKKEDLEKRVETAVQAIAKQKGLDIVINKQLVLFGGIDVTADVIAKLK